MLIRLTSPSDGEFAPLREVWIDAESVDRLEGGQDFKHKLCTIYLKRNPTEPYLVVNKHVSEVAGIINEELSPAADAVSLLAQEIKDLKSELSRRLSVKN